MSSDAQIKANQANAQLSTGPRSEEGRQTSSRNNFRHGLASGQLVIPGESQEDFDDLLSSLLEEHKPASPTESALVAEMAQHFWFGQRAVRLQCLCLAGPEPDDKRFALFLRYQATENRAFHKCLETLLKLRKEQIGFESQKRKEALGPLEVARSQELHEVKMRGMNFQAEASRERADSFRLSEPTRTRLPHIACKSSKALFEAAFPQ
jgi:hypothetical protein